MTFSACNSNGKKNKEASVPKTIDEKIDSVKGKIWTFEYLIIHHEFAVDSMMAVIPKEIAMYDKLIEWEKRSSDDTTKLIHQEYKDFNGRWYTEYIDMEILQIKGYESDLAKYRKSLDSLLQIKASQ